MSLGRLFDRDGEFVTLFFFGDLGLGSLDGGFGFVFWGLGFPAFLYLMVHAVRAVQRPAYLPSNDWWAGDLSQKRRDWFPLLFWGQLAFGLIFLFSYSINVDLLSRSGRLVLFVAGLGIVALAVVWPKISEEVPGASVLLKLLCIGGALLTLVQLGDYRHPMYDLRKGLADRIAGHSPSPYKYLFLGAVLEPLDDLTRGGQGVSVYVAGPRDTFWTAPFYGSEIQNRIWNFEPSFSTDPDALIFHHDQIRTELFYLGRRITPVEVISDPRYLLISQDRNSLFFLKGSFLEIPERREALVKYYKGISPELLPLAQSLASQLEPNATILVSSPLGYSLRYLELTREITQRVVLAPVGAEDLIARTLGEGLVYSFGRPLAGYEGKAIIKIPLSEGEFSVFQNERKG